MDKDDEEIKLLFLLSGSFNVLPASYLKLRSYLNNYSSHLAALNSLKLPKSITNRTITCPHCYIPWSSNTSTFKLLPERTASQKHKKKSKEPDEGNNEEEQSNQSRNKLVLKCTVCQRKSVFSLVKAKPAEEKVVEVEPVIKSKKRKKDKTCGLKINLNTSKSDVIPIVNCKLSNAKNEKRLENSNISITTSVKNSPAAPSKSSTSSKPENCNSVMINPYAVQIQNQNLKNKKKKLDKLKKLQKAMKEQKGSVRKTLKDFLTLVPR